MITSNMIPDMISAVLLTNNCRQVDSFCQLLRKLLQNIGFDARHAFFPPLDCTDRFDLTIPLRFSAAYAHLAASFSSYLVLGQYRQANR